jgi:hypothetical protein
MHPINVYDVINEEIIINKFIRLSLQSLGLGQKDSLLLLII